LDAGSTNSALPRGALVIGCPHFSVNSERSSESEELCSFISKLDLGFPTLLFPNTSLDSSVLRVQQVYQQPSKLNLQNPNSQTTATMVKAGKSKSFLGFTPPSSE
jgi:hypothetical protein